MIQRYICTGIILFGVLSYAAPTSALSNTISVTAVVVPSRIIYLSDKGGIAKVSSNTQQNVTPVVFSNTGVSTPLTAKIDSQYQEILKDNGGSLAAGYYYPSNSASYTQLARWIISNPYFAQKIY